MQKLTRGELVRKAEELLDNGEVKHVLGWRAGEFDYDLTPSVFDTKDDIEANFRFDDFCGPNFSKYLVKKTRELDGKILVFLKPCDTYSFNELLTEHRFDREKVYVVGIECSGMADIYDELLGEEGEEQDSGRFEEVEKLEKMTSEERFGFWKKELSRCIRCNACRDVCPACTCEKCVFDNPDSGTQNKSPATTFEEQNFHIIRAYHVAGRCTDCGECSRVCPQRIPLHLLNRKFIKDIDSFYGDYQAGQEAGQRNPLIDYTQNDIDPSEIFGGAK